MLGSGLVLGASTPDQQSPTTMNFFTPDDLNTDIAFALNDDRRKKDGDDELSTLPIRWDVRQQRLPA